MKIRTGFVSNSSSSSFAVKLVILSDSQRYKILNHSYFGATLGMECTDDEWNVWEDDNYLYGDTLMDNFDMHYFLDQIGVKPEDVTWDPVSMPKQGDSDEN